MMINQKVEQEIHKRHLYITQSVFDLCELYNIRCFLVGGSLLGAVKVGSILPGDKDVDIGMLREDYERFIALESELPDDLCLLEASRTVDYNWLFAKIYQKGTRLKQKDSSFWYDNIGIYVDIIPYDCVSATKIKRELEYKKAKLIKWSLLLKEKPLGSGLEYKIASIIGKVQSRESMIRYFSERKRKTSVVQNIVGGTNKDWFTMQEIENLQKVSLSDHIFEAPFYRRYLNLNYPGWEFQNMSRSELNKYEVEFE